MLKAFGFFSLLTVVMITANGCPLLWKDAYVEILDVQVEISEERPATVKVRIMGEMGDPITCGARLLTPTQERQGNTLRIALRAKERAGVVCYALGVNFEVAVLLEGRFAPGIYRVIVSSMANSMGKEFEIAQ